MPAGQNGDVPPEEPVILLVQLDHLGDAILSTAMLVALRRRWPRASIEVLASPWNREVFEAAAEVDRVYVSRVNRFARGLRFPLAWIGAILWWGLWLRRRQIDVGIDVRGEFPLALMLWLSGARRRLGWNCGGGGFLLTDSAEFVPGRPEAESRFALLAPLGIEPADSHAAARPRFDPGDAARRSIRGRLAELDVPGQRPRPRVVVHVGAGTPAKQWPIEHWQELIARIVLDHAAQVVLVGSPADGIIARAILGEDREVSWQRTLTPGPSPARGRGESKAGPDLCCGDLPAVVDWTGRLRLAELAALLEECDLFVGADSGPAHLAAAVGGRVAVLWSGTNDRRQWQPYGERVRVIRHAVPCQPCHRQACRWADHPCMKGLRPDCVLAAIVELLAATALHQEICSQGIRS
jgi:ADP-heptose:LPS heptosyltransferase